MEITAVTQILGAWTLVDWRIEFDGQRPATRPFGAQPIGLLVYDPSGWMSATMSARQRTPLNVASAMLASAESKASALHEYLAYTGRWRLDSSTLVHDVVTSLNPILIGTEQRREASIVEGCLHLTATESEQRDGRQKRRLHRIIWQRARSDSIP